MSELGYEAELVVLRTLGPGDDPARMAKAIDDALEPWGECAWTAADLHEQMRAELTRVRDYFSRVGSACLARSSEIFRR